MRGCGRGVVRSRTQSEPNAGVVRLERASEHLRVRGWAACERGEQGSWGQGKTGAAWYGEWA